KVLYNATLEYNGIKKIVDKQGLIYLYFDKASAIVIPKSSFKTSEDYEKAMELAGNNYVV
ncbi:MAG: YcxB family protein, partial [Clostridia bacterium]|nr:YcxB family protein [Clostridia bacterium]